MFKRQTSGSVVCPTCGRLVGVNEDRCLNCNRRKPGLWGFGPVLTRVIGDFGFTQLVIGGCGVLFVLSLLMAPGGIRTSGILSFLAPSQAAIFALGASGAAPIFDYGRWWTVLSAAWLHGGLLHIFFNMYMIRQIAPVTAELYGVGRLVIIYTISSITGFGLTSMVGYALTPSSLPVWLHWLAGAQLTLGASAPLFGIIGALYFYGQRSGNRAVGQQMLRFLVIMAIFGLLVPHVDNWAHAGGFGGGYLAARWLDPLKPERQEHLLGALLCLLAIAASLIVSFVDAQPILRALGS